MVVLLSFSGCYYNNITGESLRILFGTAVIELLSSLRLTTTAKKILTTFLIPLQLHEQCFAHSNIPQYMKTKRTEFSA